MKLGVGAGAKKKDSIAVPMVEEDNFFHIA